MVTNQALKNEIIIDKNEKINIHGISSNTITTLGTCVGHIKINNQTIEQKFHVVKDSFNNSTDNALLGRDFLVTNKIVLDFGNNIMYTCPVSITKIKNENKNDLITNIASVKFEDNNIDLMPFTKMPQITADFNVNITFTDNSQTYFSNETNFD